MNSDGLSNGAELANKKGMVLYVVESTFQICLHFPKKTSDGTKKCEKSIDDVAIWRALMASPSVVSGRASWRGLIGGMDFMGAGSCR